MPYFASSRPHRAQADGLICVMLLLLGLALAGPTTRAAHCGPGPQLADTDGDGLFDYACVGDWNDDGICQMEQDIVPAIASLDDPGAKTVELSDCEFTAPQVATGSHAIVELPSHTTLVGSGPETVLRGFAPTNVQSTQAVVSNADHVVGNTEIVIRDLTIHGGWEAGDARGLGHTRMGVFLSRCNGCRVENVIVSDTLHSCLYASNSTDVEFRNSTLRRCGNYTGLGSNFPCVYLYAAAGETLRDVRVLGIDCDGSGSVALNTRRASTDAVLAQLVFRDNIARNTRLDHTGLPKQCIVVSGVGSAEFHDTTCVNTSGFSSINAGSPYSEMGDRSASANILVDGLEIFDSFSVRAPVKIEGNAENFTLRRVSVHGAGGNCVEIRAPVRGVTLEQSTLEACGGYGIVTIGVPDAVLGLTLRGNSIASTGGGGIELMLDPVFGGSDLVISDNSIHAPCNDPAGATCSGIGVVGNVQATVVSGNSVEDVAAQASFGIYFDAPDPDPSVLCTNHCSGTLDPISCLQVPDEPTYNDDLDLDDVVDACDWDSDGDDIDDNNGDNCVNVWNPSQVDTDDDGYGDHCDNCPWDANSQQADADDDLEGDRCDLDDGTIHLVFLDSQQLEWDAEIGWNKWNLYKGDLAVLTAFGTYTQAPGSNAIAGRICSLSYPQADDTVAPPAGETAFYLVSGVSTKNESALGNDAWGKQRPNDNPCP